ncbi:MAG: ParA family protein [Pseudomonadota bacterium]|nr:ParA family protein [Pseudomonadota bacterium]MDE3037742.1 ParA family protein [Pseudomonadota bacterium]
MKTIAFFNNKGGVGKTSLVYHLAWMFAEKGVSTLAVDLDPQANLTSMFLDEERLEKLWEGDKHPETILGALDPILRGLGDIKQPHTESIDTGNLFLIPGDLALSRFEDKLSENWPKCLSGDESAFRTTTAFYRLIAQSAEQSKVQLVLIDVGPNLGAINRSAMVAAQQVILPIAPDLFSIQGLKNLGPTLRKWREEWEERKKKKPADWTEKLPGGGMQPAGYIVMQFGLRDNRPVQAYQRWLEKIPSVYRESVLNESLSSKLPSVTNDPYCVAMLKHYRSLMPLAMDARKPMFFLKPADGAIGAHVGAVKACYDDFLALVERIAKDAGISFPHSN